MRAAVGASSSRSVVARRLVARSTSSSTSSSSTSSRSSRVMAPRARASEDAEEATAVTRRARVAVVGAGAAGLASIRALRLESHDVVAYELASEVGGTWRYGEDVEDDALGTSETRARVHGSMYASLRTNLPREVMGYQEFPFDGRRHYGDERRFCGHEEVQAYLREYAETFELSKDVRFDTRVSSIERRVRKNEEEEARWSSEWVVTSMSEREGERREIFDAVVVANGHYSEPRVPEFPGAERWPGEQIHSHNYRKPDAFAGKRVLLIGAMASGEDISREISTVADTVYLSARSWQNPDWANSTEGIGARGNIFRKPNVKEFKSDGSVIFENGTSVECDVCMYCTGYKYHFPFISNDVVSVDDNHVAPLYEHCIAANAPSMSFIGLPWKVVPFPMFELQSRWIARMLSGVVPMPSKAEALEGAAALEAKLEPLGPIPRRHAHMFGDAQFEYNERIARMANLDSHGSWRARMYKATGLNKRAHPDQYRDAAMPDISELEEARREFETA